MAIIRPGSWILTGGGSFTDILFQLLDSTDPRIHTQIISGTPIPREEVWEKGEDWRVLIQPQFCWCDSGDILAGSDQEKCAPNVLPDSVGTPEHRITESHNGLGGKGP